MWSEMLALFREYMGTALSVIGFVCALIFLWKYEKRKELRIIFIYVPLVLLLIYFNPWFAKLVQEPAGSGGYSRILWLIPFTMVVAYAIVYAYGILSQRKRWIMVFGIVGLIVVSGNYMYQDPNFRKAENIYHVPDSVVHICDAIYAPGREVMAVFPEELLQYVRQYSPVTRMPYGQDVTERTDVAERMLYETMEADVIYLDKLVPLSREFSCHFIVLPVEKEIKGTPEYYGLVWIGETDGYAIYRDVEVELVVP